MRILDYLYRLALTSEGDLSQLIYAPLRSSRSIRLLQLHPGKPGYRNSPVECELTLASVGDGQKYEALSYTWGSWDNTKTVKCDPIDVKVTKNLYAALTRLRYRDRTRTLWVDALCINQRDAFERNQQLSLMGEIYQGADQVVAWIGEETSTLEAVTGLFSQLTVLEPDKQRLVYLDSATLEQLGLPREQAPVWAAVRRFFRRAWFQRVWVIQEAANASKLDIVCGLKHIDWDNLIYAARCIAESQMFAATDTALICQHIVFIDQCRGMLKKTTEERLSLLDLLYRSRSCGASDLRDKIYGLYPIASDRDSLPQPDYYKSPATVYKETAAHLLNTHRDLNILSCAGAARDPKTRHLNLPSWVPDWHSYDKSKSMTFSYTKPAVYSPKARWFEIASDQEEMTVSCNIVDEVDAISDVITPFHGPIKGESVNFLLRDWPDATTVLQPTGETVRILDIYANPNIKHPEQPLPQWNALLEDDEFQSRYKREVSKLLYRRRVFRSMRGYLGVVPATAKVGDKYVLFKGTSGPYIIRRKRDAYKLIGECYIGQSRDDDQDRVDPRMVRRIKLV